MTLEDIFICDNGHPSSRICFGDKLSGVGTVVAQMTPGPVFIIADGNVRKYAQEVALSLQSDIFHPCKGIMDVKVSEKGKTMETVMEISSWLLDRGADRNAVLIAVGGGITTDIVGFTASIYKRGVRFGYVPTTVLAQTDAAIGGKTGVNFRTYKNILGTISQPVFVYICQSPLSTLPQRDFISGAAELIKTFIIEDCGQYEKIIAYMTERKASWQSSPSNPGDLFLSLLAAAAKVKAGIVSRDQFEKGERRKLNFGHTFAHAIESVSSREGYDITHGEAVSAGIIMAAVLSEACGYASVGLAERLRHDFVGAGLRVSVPFSLTELSEAMKKDKKAEGEIVHFVLIEDIGKVMIADMTVENAVKAMEQRYLE